ncbi:MAG: hypothetical protein KKI08_27615 [Armatimonadetes bacterium]|nr:hypothetical protein [Armatimonadota bacterium]
MPRPTLAFLALTLAVSAHAAVLYRSDFQQLPDGTAQVPGWTLAGGDYRIQSGWLTVKSERSNPVATLQAAVGGDFTFRARVRGALRVHWAALRVGPYRLEVNRQFVRLALMQEGQDAPVAAVPNYTRFAERGDVFELRLVHKGDRLLGFIDSRELIDVELGEPLPPDAPLGLLSGWGTDVAWGEISLSDEADEREWPRETLPEPTGRKYVEVLKVRGYSDKQPDDNVYFTGEKAGLRYLVRILPEAPPTVVVRVRLLDVRGQQTEQALRKMDRSGSPWYSVYSTIPPGPGCYKLALYAGPDEDHLGWVEDLGSFTVVSPALDTRARIPNSYFGGHMDGIHLQWHLQQARRIGVQWARCHDMMQWTWWDRIQPDGPDQWKWGDNAQATVDRLGFGTSGEFLWVPKWAQNPQMPPGRSPRTYPPADMAAFAKYVYETVSHFKGSIHVWEMWNEPHYGGFFSGSPEQYAQMLQVAYREAKRADPTCLVMGGGGVNMQSMDWIARMLKAAGGQCMDLFSIHYLSPDSAASDMAWLHARLAEVGFSGPIWNTEESVLSSSFLDQCRADAAEPEARYHFRNACYELVRTMMENLSNGVSRVFYYELADPWRMKPSDKPRVYEPSRLTTSLWDEGQMLKPTAAAYAALALAIDGKPFVEKITVRPGVGAVTDRDRLEAFIFGDAQTAAAVQYARFPTYAQREELRLKLPAGFDASKLSVMDFMGNERPAAPADGTLVLPLSREPVYLLYTGPDAAAQLARLVRSGN